MFLDGSAEGTNGMSRWLRVTDWQRERLAINFSAFGHQPIRVSPRAARRGKQATRPDALGTEQGGAVRGGEFGHKRACPWSDADRGVVGPGYTSQPVAAIHRLGVARLAKGLSLRRQKKSGGGTLDLYTLKGIWMGCWWTEEPVSISCCTHCLRSLVTRKKN
jgi:hypothetical protein